MGVYNPNMKMPKNCTECLEFKDDCDYYWDYYCTHKSRPNDCPLIEIIICKECKHWERDEECKIDSFWEKFTKLTDFCSYGERRTDEHNTKRD